MTEEEVRDALMRMDTFDTPEVQEQLYKIDEFARRAQFQHNVIMERWISTMCTTRVEPPIKGEITIGELRLRGIALEISSPKPGVTHYVLTQRGNSISKLEERHTSNFKDYTTTITYRLLE